MLGHVQLFISHDSKLLGKNGFGKVENSIVVIFVQVTNSF